MSNGGAVYTHDADLEVKNQFLTITLTTNHAVYDALQIVYLRAVILTPAGTKKKSSSFLEVVPFYIQACFLDVFPANVGYSGFAGNLRFLEILP